NEGVEYACAPVEPPAPAPATTAPTTTLPTETTLEPREPPTFTPTLPRTPPPVVKPPKSAGPQVRERPRPKRKRKQEVKPPAPVFRPPPLVSARLTAGGYVFPVFGPAAFVDTFGAGRAVVGWHHGEDIFAPQGAPVLAVADGTVFSVGWNDVGGNRLWLRDRQGNEFYYAHLSAFSTLAVDGAHVRAGAVLGFIGNTGDAETTPPHLHFEIHPVGLLSLGYDGVVNPNPFLSAWRRVEDVPLGAAALVFTPNARAGQPAAPVPGAILLQSSDISTASGLQPGSLQAAVEEPLDASEMPPVAELVLGRAPLSSAASRANTEAELRARAVEFARSVSTDPLDKGVWDTLAQCEAGGNWATDTGNGYAGGLQFAPGTWFAYGGTAYAPSPALASRSEQIAIARLVLAGQGWRAWPACSAKLGLQTGERRPSILDAR
ncbi:MAG: transglycosylase family protein, partial [Actinomycetota bacterium]|nr:transglycosylase family protein [Actinomycetota bacterium]